MISGKVDADYVALLARRMRRYRTLFNAQDGICAYCPTRLTYLVAPDGTNYPNTITRDHYVPLCKRGSRRNKNIVGACHRCNTLKGQMTGDTFKRVIAGNPSLFAVATKPLPDPEPRKKRHKRSNTKRPLQPTGQPGPTAEYDTHAG